MRRLDAFLHRLRDLVRRDRLAARGLRRQPGFATAAILTLALGIGANTAIFSVVRGILLRPLPFQEPDRLVQLLGYDREEGLDRGTISYPNFEDVRSSAESFSALAIFDDWDILVEWEDGAEKLAGATVSASYFETLGVPPVVGRFFLPAEDVPGAAQSVVLSNGLWRRRFGADPGVVGRTLDLNGYTYEIVGVAPADLEEPGLATSGRPPAEVWRPPRSYFATGSSRDGRAFTAALAVLTALLFGLAPALRLARADLNALIDETRRGTTGGTPGGRGRRVLIAAEVAVALVLLVASALVARSLGELQRVPTGLATGELLSTRLTTPPGRYEEPAAALALYDRLLERVTALPGARSAATVNILPMSGHFDGRGFIIDGRPEPAPGEGPSAEARTVSPG